MRGFSYPGVTSSNRVLAQMLSQNSRSANNGSDLGGLAHVLQQALAGYMMGKDGRDQTAAYEAMGKGMSAKPWTPPDDRIAMGPSGTPDGDMWMTKSEAMSRAAPAGGYEGGLASLSKLGGNEYAGRLSQQLMMNKMERDQALADRSDELLTAYDPEKGGSVYMRRGDVKPGTMAKGPNLPASAEEYNFAKGTAGGGYTGTYQDFLKWKAEVGASKTDDPSNVREYRYFLTLSPEERQQYLLVKRANPYLNLGDRFAQPNPLQPGSETGSFPVGLGPDRKVQDGQVITMPAVPGGGVPDMSGGALPPFDPNAPASMPGEPVVQALPPTPKEAAATTERQRQEAQAANIVLQDIDKVISAVSNPDNIVPRAGPVGGTLAMVPGTPQYDIGQTLSTIKANIGFDKLQKMRAASPTGGALGAVSEFENRLLQSVFGNLEQSQSQEQLVANLRRLRTIYDRIVNQGIPEEEARAMLQQMEGGGAGQAKEYDWVPGRGLVPRGQ